MSPFFTVGDEPVLTAAVVDDEEQLAAAVDAFNVANADDRVQRAELLERQAELHLVLDAKEWQMFLAVEEASTARLADLTVSIARWAFRQGRASSSTEVSR